MSDGFWILLLFITAAVLLLWVRRTSAQLEEARRQRDEIESTEERMFDFLHVLGIEIEDDGPRHRLHRLIVDGVAEVVGASGGAIYLAGDDGESLVPGYLSEQCPPLVGVPPEVGHKAKDDPRALESHLRLARIGIREGVPGHCLALGEPVLVRDLAAHPAARDSPPPVDGRVEAMLAPLRHAGRDIGLLAVARSFASGGFSGNEFGMFRSVAEQAGFAIGNALAHLEMREKRRLEDEIRTAREVQRVLLPESEPLIPGYRVFGANLPARVISGDYYDYLDLGGGRHGIAIADVSGKGVPAGLLMAMCRSVLRSVAPGEESPARVLAAVNRQLFPDIREDMFISMAYLLVDGPAGRVVAARAGHDPPLCFRSRDGTVRELRSPGLAIGIDGGEVFERVTADVEVLLEAGDCLLLHTDGVREAADERDEEFGLARASEVFGKAARLGAEAAVEAILGELRAFGGAAPQMDDVTVVAVEKR